MDNETPAPTDNQNSAPSEPVAANEPTEIPVTEAPPEAPAPEAAPSEPAPEPEQQPSVVGTPDVPALSGEQVGEAQPPAPNPVPATAAPDADTVTLNTHLRQVNSDLQDLKAYVENFLNVIENKDSIQNALENVVIVVNESIKE